MSIHTPRWKYKYFYCLWNLHTQRHIYLFSLILHLLELLPKCSQMEVPFILYLFQTSILVLSHPAILTFRTCCFPPAHSDIYQKSSYISLIKFMFSLGNIQFHTTPEAFLHFNHWQMPTMSNLWIWVTGKSAKISHFSFYWTTNYEQIHEILCLNAFLVLIGRLRNTCLTQNEWHAGSSRAPNH